MKFVSLLKIQLTKIDPYENRKFKQIVFIEEIEGVTEGSHAKKSTRPRWFSKKILLNFHRT